MTKLLLLVVCLALVAPADAACTTSSVAELVYKVRAYIFSQTPSLPRPQLPAARPVWLVWGTGGRQPGDAA